MIENSHLSTLESWQPRKISVVVPVFNEKTNLEAFFDLFSKNAAPFHLYEWEWIFVDDGSTDDSFEKILELRKRDSRVKLLRLSRNFGSHSALTAGLAYATGNAAILLPVDMQGPSRMIKDFIGEWQKGAQVVWGIPRSRKDSWAKRLLTKLFYQICHKVALPNYPQEGMDGCLLDRQVIDSLLTIKESDSFLFATILWMGFRQVFVPYDGAARTNVISKISFSKFMKKALDVIVSFSYFPIRFMMNLGIILSGISFLVAFKILAEVSLGIQHPGSPFLMTAILFLSGVQLMMMGILGEYIWRGTDQLKGRPRFIVMEKAGFEPAKILKGSR